MKQIKEQSVERLIQKGAGIYDNGRYFADQNSNGVVIHGRVGVFLANQSDFFYDHSTFKWKPKPHLILAIGGLIPTNLQILAKQFNLTEQQASLIISFRRQPQYSEELEKKLIAEIKNKNIHAIDIPLFGLSTEQKVQKYWNMRQKHIIKVR